MAHVARVRYRAFHMLRRIVKGSGLAERVRAVWRHDAEQAMKPLRADLRRLQHEVERLSAALADVSQRAARGDQLAAQIKHVMEADSRDRERLAAVDAVLGERRIAAHVRDAVAAATIATEPYHHVVVDNLFPDDVYRLLIEALPPVEFFTQRDPVKQDLPLPIEFGPALSVRVWNFVDEVIAQRIVRPAIVDKFDVPLQMHYAEVFGPEFRDRARALPQATSGGRLMLRRPGYHLDPHRDPKRSLVTCLLYLARPNDSDVHGTQIFRVEDDIEAGYKQTYYPGQDGRRCELVRVVPFRANSMLAFLNARGAHGASIPADAPASLERYTYQFYVAPRSDLLSELIRDLPKERRAMWRNKARVDAII